MSKLLTVATVKGLTKPGRYADGLGLYLDVRGGSRVWVYRYQLANKDRLMSLGSVETVTLAEARKAHAAARAEVLLGRDPLAARHVAKAENTAPASFSEAAAAYIAAHRAGWRGRTEEHWRKSLAAYAFPAFGGKPIAAVDREDVLRCLSPIWTTKTATATNLRNRIELVLDYGIARGWRPTDVNPARWKGGLKALLAAPAKVHTVEHRAALPWREAPGVMQALLTDDGMAARCLAFCILTATRSAEARGALWSEIDLDAATWTIPGPRMKARKPHAIPLSEPAMDILRMRSEVRSGDKVFLATPRRAGLLSDSTLRDVLHRLAPGMTVHGMRSCFAQWAQDHGHASELIEQSLAHTVGTAVSRAYQRSDVIERRRLLMQAWADFLTHTAEVVALAA